MRDCKSFFKGMSILPYIIMVWLPLFFSWRETVEQIRLPDARQIGLLLNSVKLGGLAALLTCVLGGLAANYIHKGWLSDRWYRYFFVLLLYLCIIVDVSDQSVIFHPSRHFKIFSTRLWSLPFRGNHDIPSYYHIIDSFCS